MLREPEARDRTALIELFASPQVVTYIGGPQSREGLERVIPAAWGADQWLGVWSPPA